MDFSFSHKNLISSKAIQILLGIIALLALSPNQGFCSKNLLPRIPELVIEKGYSDAFEVSDCSAKINIFQEQAESELRILLKNISDSPINSSLKLRILYNISDHSTQVRINGKGIRFSGKNPRFPISLMPGEQVDLEISSRQSIQYSRDALKKALEEKDESDRNKSAFSKFGIGDLTKFFERENYGLRYMIGPIVSKWGIFPVEFRKASIRVHVPRDFDGVFPDSELWKTEKKSNATIFIFEGDTGFTGAVFMPVRDVDEFVKNRQEAESRLQNQAQ